MYKKPLISFDYAIKYLLRHKSDYDIVEGFISALLATRHYPPVKICALLESESNKERMSMKKSIADLVVEDQDGHQYIVEIERSYTKTFLHKALFNSSRLIIDSIPENKSYMRIKKIFHISLLYFDMPHIKQPIYHGTTRFHEIDTQHLDHNKKPDLTNNILASSSIFPEYFMIWVPAFQDVIHSEIDEWLYVMKNFDVYEDFKSPYMEQVKQKLNVLRMEANEYQAYIYYLKKAVESQDHLSSAEEKGRQKGLEQGLKKGRLEGLEQGRLEGLEQGRLEAERETHVQHAQRMLEKGLSVELVADITALSLHEVKKIAAAINAQ